VNPIRRFRDPFNWLSAFLRNLLRRLRRAVSKLSEFLRRGAVSVIKVLAWLTHGLVWRWWFGYGERPLRVLVVAALALVATWLLY
jgi:hypothetical protein